MERTTISISVPPRPARSYTIHIGVRLLDCALGELRRDWPGRRIFLVSDRHLEAAGHVARFVGEQDIDRFIMDPPGEVSKTIATALAVVACMEERRFGRDALLVALGGGTVGDLGGFAAAVFKRGVPYVQIPTTTVSQADSAIGGKVGVDSDLSKNAYGAFHHPARVYMDLDTLRTLDERDYRAGLVESVKHALIADAEYFVWLEGNLPALLARDAAALGRLAERNCAIKGRIVEQDPEEEGLRRVLNFGHTVGHAVEAASGYRLLHGECVSIGIVAACRLGERLGITPPEVRRRAVALLQGLGQPVRLPQGVPSAALNDAMSRDKKALGARPRCVMLEALGRVYASNGEYAKEADMGVVAEVLAELRG